MNANTRAAIATAAAVAAAAFAYGVADAIASGARPGPVKTAERSQVVAQQAHGLIALRSLRTGTLRPRSVPECGHPYGGTSGAWICTTYLAGKPQPFAFRAIVAPNGRVIAIRRMSATRARTSAQRATLRFALASQARGLATWMSYRRGTSAVFRLPACFRIKRGAAWCRVLYANAGRTSVVKAVFNPRSKRVVRVVS